MSDAQTPRTHMFLPTLLGSDSKGDLARFIVVGVISAGGYALLIRWFAQTDFYGTHFFDKGTIVTQYNSLRVCFIAAIAWLTYAPGAALLGLVGGERAVGKLSAG